MDDEEKAMQDRKELVEAIDKIDQAFEKQLVYISAGSLVLSMTFIEKITPLAKSHFLLVLILSWLFLASCLILNLISHYISGIDHRNLLEEGMANQSVSHANWEKRAGRMKIINKLSITFICLGILLFITFVSINVLNMKTDNTKKDIIINPVREDSDRLGKIIVKPIMTSPQPAPTEGDSKK